MDKPFNHLIICLTFVMPVAALSGCSGPNDSPEQDAVMSISSCTARGDDGQEMSVSEFGMFVTDTAVSGQHPSPQPVREMDIRGDFPVGRG